MKPSDKLSPATHQRVDAAREKFLPTGLSRYIQCRKKVLRYPTLKDAEAALPRIHRADPSARIVPPEETYELLKSTSPEDVVGSKTR